MWLGWVCNYVHARLHLDVSDYETIPQHSHADTHNIQWAEPARQPTPTPTSTEWMLPAMMPSDIHTHTPKIQGHHNHITHEITLNDTLSINHTVIHNSKNTIIDTPNTSIFHLSPITGTNKR